MIIAITISPLSSKALESNVNANVQTSTTGAIQITLKNGIAKVKLGNYYVTVKSTNNTDNYDVVIIPSSSENLNWLSNSLKSYKILNAYNISFYKNGKKTMPKGKITMHFMESVGKKIFFLDSNGNQISTNESYINVTSNDGYVVVGEKMNNKAQTPKTSENKIYIDCDKNGSVALDGIIYKGTQQISINKGKIKLAIIPNQNYEISQVLVNDSDYTNIVAGGFIYLKKGDSIKILFKKETNFSAPTYNLSGRVTQNNKPLKNVKVVLHSKEMITLTNNKGYYEFKNVPTGHHTISIYNGKNLIGYKDFNIKSGNITSIDQIETININSLIKNITLNMDIKNYEINFTSIKEKQETSDVINNPSQGKNNQNNENALIKLLSVIIIALILLIICLKRKHKTKHEPKEQIEILKL